MTSTITSLGIPAQSVIAGTIVGMLVLLVSALLTDYQGSPLKMVSRYVMVFSAPLLVWFAFNMIVKVTRIIIS